jgi:hypothetical protein
MLIMALKTDQIRKILATAQLVITHSRNGNLPSECLCLFYVGLKFGLLTEKRRLRVFGNA